MQAGPARYAGVDQFIVILCHTPLSFLARIFTGQNKNGVTLGINSRIGSPGCLLKKHPSIIPVEKSHAAIDVNAW